jgi:hypothetical protein
LFFCSFFKILFLGQCNALFCAISVFLENKYFFVFFAKNIF